MSWKAELGNGFAKLQILGFQFQTSRPLPQHNAFQILMLRSRENFLHYSYFIIFVLLDHVTLLPVDVVESQFDNYLLSCKYLKSRVFRGAIVVMSSSQWLFATWISMFPQLRTEREIFCCKKTVSCFVIICN